jgi:hypothetical protein
MRTSDDLLWVESLPRLPGYSCVDVAYGNSLEQPHLTFTLTAEG